MTNNVLALFSMPGGTEWLVILMLGLLLFGRRLPDVARSVGKSIVEFKKGLKDARDQIEDSSNEPPRANAKLERKSPEPRTAEHEPAESSSKP